MSEVIGRESEKAELDRLMKSSLPELVVVYGRRRVGKTFLIRQQLAGSIVFELTGLHNETLSRQLENFSIQLSQYCRQEMPPVQSWLQAFGQLQTWLAKDRSKKRRVLFFDEFPWLATRRSGFLSAFESFWNKFASRDRRLVCVICGSAAAWMIQHVLNSKGGLHNRATARMRLLPFSLSETRQFLNYRGIKLPDFQIAQLYMAIGGVPHYLQRLEPGKSAAQNIDRLCFQKDGLLTNEFSNLYQALFENAVLHENIIRALATRRKGLTRNELSHLVAVPSGGTFTKALRELAESGFIREQPAYGKLRKDCQWRLVDEYSLFYLTWMESNRMSGSNVWLTKSAGLKYKSWCGYAFENLCQTHIPQIKQSLGISGVLTEEASWQHVAHSSVDEGAQIDLLIDRSDHTINVCEMKFADAPFVIDKQYAKELSRKLSVFRGETQTKKAIFLTLVTAHGLKPNIHSVETVTNEVTLADLFNQ